MPSSRHQAVRGNKILGRNALRSADAVKYRRILSCRRCSLPARQPALFWAAPGRNGFGSADHKVPRTYPREGLQHLARETLPTRHLAPPRLHSRLSICLSLAQPAGPSVPGDVKASQNFHGPNGSIRRSGRYEAAPSLDLRTSLDLVREARYTWGRAAAHPRAQAAGVASFMPGLSSATLFGLGGVGLACAAGDPARGGGGLRRRRGECFPPAGAGRGEGCSLGVTAGRLAGGIPPLSVSTLHPLGWPKMRPKFWGASYLLQVRQSGAGMGWGGEA